MSIENNPIKVRLARHRDIIASGFSIYKFRSPNQSETALWLKYFQDGGSVAGFLQEIRDDDARTEPLQRNGIPVANPRIGGGAATAACTTRGSDPNGKLVAVLSTYPPEPPQHGGQHRLRNIGFAYRRAGFNTRHVGVLGGPGYSHTPGFLDYPGGDALKNVMASPSLMEDWVLGEMFGRPGPYLDAFLDISGPPPDLIHVEQPWLFQLARRWSESGSGIPLVIYGSQNIEHTLKFKIVKSYFGDAAAIDARQKVLDIELAAVKGADAVLAVSNEDCDWLGKYRSDKVILAANGVAERKSTMPGLIEANAVSRNSKFALVCGSAHPPNISSMFEIFGGGFACFSPRERLVLAGGIGPALRADSRFASNTSLHAFMSDGGIVSEECIQGLLETAHVILLPITSGEGSNLKTAEALWAGRHIVATRTAMRGFEAFMKADGLVIVDDRRSFLHAIRTAMEKPPMNVSDSEMEMRRGLLWEKTLEQMTNFALSR